MQVLLEPWETLIKYVTNYISKRTDSIQCSKKIHHECAVRDNLKKCKFVINLVTYRINYYNITDSDILKNVNWTNCSNIQGELNLFITGIFIKSE